MTATQFPVPFRSTLPVPLPANIVPFPGLLDRPVLIFGDPSDGVAVLSADAVASASLAGALTDGCLDGLDPAGGRRKVALTRQEVEALGTYAALAAEWESASRRGDRGALDETLAALRQIGGSDAVDVQFVMPPRRRAA